MDVCPFCGTEIRAGFNTCAGCRADRVPDRSKGLDQMPVWILLAIVAMIVGPVVATDHGYSIFLGFVPAIACMFFGYRSLNRPTTKMIWIKSRGA